MPAALDPKEKAEIVDRLFRVFREHGYEGASLADLSRATGLGKSSLYHHFPRGKEQMAEAVLEQARGFVDTAIAGVAASPDPLRTRVRRIIAALDEIYASGRNACVLGQLAGSGIGPDGRRRLQEVFAVWIDAIALLARDSGMPPARARHFAEDWVARLQGSLLLQAANGDAGPFKRAMVLLLDLTQSTKG